MMRTLISIHISAISLVTLLSVCAHAEDSQANSVNLSEVYGKAALVGMQLTVQKRASEGKFSNDIAACVKDLSSSTFNPLFDIAIKENLSADEIAAATTFFSSAAGQKYSKTAIVQLYRSMGTDSPEAMPEFSANEYADLSKFSHTSAGEKLIMKRILEGGSAQQAMGAKVQELLHNCNDQQSMAKR